MKDMQKSSLDGMRVALVIQTIITSQIVDRLAASPTSQDFLDLLASANRQMMLNQTGMITDYLRASQKKGSTTRSRKFLIKEEQAKRRTGTGEPRKSCA